jgi:CRISPR-associated protein Csb1
MNESTDILTKFDHYLDPKGPAAMVVREPLMPAEGAEAVFFPATYAEIGYNIDGSDRSKEPSAQNIALVDSVGSQANRIEPLFTVSPLDALVPQIIIKAGEKSVNLLLVGHRAGDALVRCSGLKDQLQEAFKAVLKGNAMLLAKIAPTSLVFGVWDSRDTQAKLPRLIASTIRAYNVRKLTRSAVYSAPVDYVKEGVLSEEDAAKAEGQAKNPLSSTGFVNALANSTHGGVVAEGGIRRDATLAISALRLLKADNDENTKKLRRYILGLALAAFTRLPLGYYRQGTILVLATNKEGNPLPRQFVEVLTNGARTDVSSKINETLALTYAQAAAADFGVGSGREVKFDDKNAKEAIAEAKKKK